MCVTGPWGDGPRFPLVPPCSWASLLRNAGPCASPLPSPLQASPASAATQGQGSLKEATAFHLKIDTGVSIIVAVTGAGKGLDALGVGAVCTCLF